MSRTREFEGFTTKIPKNTFRYGGSFFLGLENATHENIRKHLGTSLSGERKEKYSSELFVMDKDTRFVYSVYMADGQWRIGSVETIKDVNLHYGNKLYKQVGERLQSILNK